MQISILGSLRVRSLGAKLGPQKFDGVKPRELLALLLLARGRPVTKDTLAEKLWPDRLPKNVDGTLETYVSLVRKNLFGERDTARRVLSTGAGAYTFATDQIVLDLDLFDDLVARAELPDNDRGLLLTRAASLLRGDLLEDIGDPEWVRSERELYRDRATRVHLSAGDESLGVRAYAAAMVHAESALRIRPYTEEAFRSLMLGNYALGNAEGARLVFQRCRELLGADLGHDLTSETEDLFGNISAGVPVLELLPVSPPGRMRLVQAALPPPNRRDPARQLPFIGRQIEIDAISGHVDISRGGVFQLVMVTGMPGIGRSALLGQLYGSLPGLVGRQFFTALDSERPELPLTRALSHALEGGSGAVEATQYGAAPFVDESQEVLLRLASLVSNHAPMVLLLDDLQWADVGTIDALAWLAASVPHLPLTIVATVRDSPTGGNDKLDLLVPHHEVRLDPLQVESTRQYGVDDELVESTGGLPTFLADSWRWALAGGSGPSPSLRDSVLRSVRGLGGPHASLLQAMSELDELVHPRDMSAGSDAGAPVVLATLDELCQLGILDRVGPKYRFQAPVVREVVASTVPQLRGESPLSRCVHPTVQ